MDHYKQHAADFLIYSYQKCRKVQTIHTVRTRLIGRKQKVTPPHSIAYLITKYLRASLKKRTQTNTSEHVENLRHNPFTTPFIKPTSRPTRVE